MCLNGNIRRRLSIREQRNRISIGIAIILVLSIYLTINSIEKSSKKVMVNALKTSVCPQLSSSSKGYFRVDLIENSWMNSSLICQSNDVLLIYILSNARNIQRRDFIRRTWANKKSYQQLTKICFVFILALPTNDLKSSITINDIEHESSIYHDIILIKIEESYQNVVYKEVAALKWSHIYVSHIPFLFKTDDDLIIDTLLLNEIIQLIRLNTTDQTPYLRSYSFMKQFIQEMSQVDPYTLFRGKDIGGIRTIRSGKFGVYHLAWNDDKLPPYCSGFGILYSSFIRDRLYRASLCYANEYVPLVGDIFLSGFLAGAASVRCSGWLLRNLQTSQSCAKLYLENPRVLVCSTPLHRGKQVFTEFHSAWQAVLRRHNVHLTTNITNQINL